MFSEPLESPSDFSLNLCRVLALKALCEARLDREDLRGRVEDAIRPSKETRMAAKATGVLPSVDDFRRGPLGVDSSGLEYHYFELRLCTEGAGLLCLLTR